MTKAVDIDLEKVKVLAGRGLSNNQIAQALGIHRATLYNHKKANPEIEEAIEDGRQAAIGKVVNALFTNALSGNVSAQIFFLKNKDPDNWSDKREVNTNTALRPRLIMTCSASAEVASVEG